MAVHQITFEQLIPATRDTVWAFISSPENLAVITPDYMQFKITNELPKKTMYTGQIITYKVSPVLGIPLNWCTEITHVEQQHYFVDEQRSGPYAMWHHEHHLEDTKNGILMTDIVHYKLPLGWLGELAHRLFVKKQLASIFNYRAEKIETYFGKVEMH